MQKATLVVTQSITTLSGSFNFRRTMSFTTTDKVNIVRRYVRTSCLHHCTILVPRPALGHPRGDVFANVAALARREIGRVHGRFVNTDPKSLLPSVLTAQTNWLHKLTSIYVDRCFKFTHRVCWVINNSNVQAFSFSCSVPDKPSPNWCLK